MSLHFRMRHRKKVRLGKQNKRWVQIAVTFPTREFAPPALPIVVGSREPCEKSHWVIKSTLYYKGFLGVT